jgi:O-antigen biosynthesis protein
MPNDHITPSDQSESSSPIRGLIEKSTLRYTRSGKTEVTISGWLLYDHASIVILQFALPGSEVSLARRIERPDIGIKFSSSPGGYNSGFNAVLQLSDRSEVLTEVYFTAILDNGLIIAGSLELPTTSIQSSAHNFFIEKNNSITRKQKTVSAVDNEEIKYPAQNQTTSHATAELNHVDKKQVLELEHSKGGISTYINNINDINESLKSSIKESHRISAMTKLIAFLSFDSKISFTPPEKPNTSIVLILHNKAEYTLECLKSIQQSEKSDFEVVVIDNASTDQTRLLLSKIEGIKVLYNSENEHFVKGVNQAVRVSSGENILLLNNDTTITPTSITHAEETLAKPGVGAVGGRIIQLDGSLQEAGYTVLSDGRSFPYGHGEDPLDYKYLFKRSVDYCSGAFLLTKRSLFDASNGFDLSFAPAYFEEADYCLKLIHAGYKVIYDPRCVIFHVGNGSSTKAEVQTLQTRNFITFKEKHRESLKKHLNLKDTVKKFGRGTFDRRKRVLIIDDVIPFDHHGAGAPRSRLLLNTLSELDLDVTYFSTKPQKSLSWHYLHGVIPMEVECVPFMGKEKLSTFLIERADFYDTILISRPHNMEYFNAALEKMDSISLHAQIIYDVESLYAEREILRMDILEKIKLSDSEKDYILGKELEIAKSSHNIVVVSSKDAATFKDAGFSNIEVISYGSSIHQSTNSFEDRNDILFVGPVSKKDSANLDGIQWFIHEVLPILREKYDFKNSFRIIGDYQIETIQSLQVSGVFFHGAVKDLSEIYHKHRIAIAPIRFAAGISLKVIEAASYGLPVVATDLIADLLGWEKQVEIASISSPEGFAYACHVLYQDKEMWNIVRNNALALIEESYSMNSFANSIKKTFLAS